MEDHTLLLVDGMALAYRSFYAIRELSTSEGLPTNALLGFIRKLQQYDKQWNPTHRAVVFDGGMPEARLALLEDYKAQRPPMPDLLRRQLEFINTYLEYARYPQLRLDREEADDVIAALAVQAAGQQAHTLIATNDKDIYQIVNERIRIIPPAKADKLIGPEGVHAKTGVPPQQVPDWLALVGDSADNIPGVPGVGTKTAARWLQQYPSLDALYEHQDELKPPRLAQALEAYREQVYRNLEIVQLRLDLDVPLSWEDLAVREPAADALLKFAAKFELKSLEKSIRDTIQPELFN
jgi:DNA polymerase-1